MLVKDLPIEIQDKWVVNQIKQGNSEDRDLDINWGKSAGGFRWGVSIEGQNFWREVSKGNFDHFYEKYPKKTSKETKALGSEWGINIYSETKYWFKRKEDIGLFPFEGVILFLGITEFRVQDDDRYHKISDFEVTEAEPVQKEPEKSPFIQKYNGTKVYSNTLYTFKSVHNSVIEGYFKTLSSKGQFSLKDMEKKLPCNCWDLYNEDTTQLLHKSNFPKVKEKGSYILGTEILPNTVYYGTTDQESEFSQFFFKTPSKIDSGNILKKVSGITKTTFYTGGNSLIGKDQVESISVINNGTLLAWYERCIKAEMIVDGVGVGTYGFTLNKSLEIKKESVIKKDTWQDFDSESVKIAKYYAGIDTVEMKNPCKDICKDIEEFPLSPLRECTLPTSEEDWGIQDIFSKEVHKDKKRTKIKVRRTIIN